MDSPVTPDKFTVTVPIVAGVGNALMAVPMVRQIRRHRPEAQVSVVALTDAMAEPFRRLREVNEVFVSGKGTSGYARGIRFTRRHHPDVYLVPFPSNRWQYNMLAAASRARRVVMHEYPIGAWSTFTFVSGAERISAQRGIHDVVQNLRLLRVLGINPDETERPEFMVNATDRGRAAELLHRAEVRGDERFIAIHAGSARTVLAQAKRWPTENYAELITEFRREMSQPIVLLEGPDEGGVADEIVARLKTNISEFSVLKLAGPLGDVAAVLERAALYVGSDSGLAHLAAAVGTPAVTLFGPADPDRVCPFGYRHLVVQAPRDCSPCMLYPWQATRPIVRCREPMCITSITVDSILSKTRTALLETARRKEPAAKL